MLFYGAFLLDEPGRRHAAAPLEGAKKSAHIPMVMSACERRLGFGRPLMTR